MKTLALEQFAFAILPYMHFVLSQGLRMQFC